MFRRIKRAWDEFQFTRRTRRDARLDIDNREDAVLRKLGSRPLEPDATNPADARLLSDLRGGAEVEEAQQDLFRAEEELGGMASFLLCLFGIFVFGFGEYFANVYVIRALGLRGQMVGVLALTLTSLIVVITWFTVHLATQQMVDKEAANE